MRSSPIMRQAERVTLPYKMKTVEFEGEKFEIPDFENNPIIISAN